MKQNNVVTLAAMKARGEKISQLTCYDYSTARLMDQAGINMILVGDSLGMTMQGYSDTLPVTLEEMILYGRSVARGCRNAFVVLDMPFMSYQVSPEQALANAGRMMKETGRGRCEAGGRRRDLPPDPGHHRRRHSGLRPCGDDPAVLPRFWGLYGTGQGGSRRGPSAEGCLGGAGSWGLCRGSGVCSP